MKSSKKRLKNLSKPLFFYLNNLMSFEKIRLFIGLKSRGENLIKPLERNTKERPIITKL
jgi:hypothetical protein